MMQTFASRRAVRGLRRFRGAALVVLVLVACGDVEPEPDAVDAPVTTVAAATPSNGTVELDGTTYEFTVNRCDLTGGRPDGMLLEGSGTAPDGRRLKVEVERLERSETTWERATIYFGSIVEGDSWTARLAGWPDGRWFADDAPADPVDGPLHRVSGDQLLIQSTFRHETTRDAAQGELRVTCTR